MSARISEVRQLRRGLAQALARDGLGPEADEGDEEDVTRARYSGKGICPACGSQPWRVRGSRCYKCRLRAGDEPGVEEAARSWAAKDHQWGGYF